MQVPEGGPQRQVQCQLLELIKDHCLSQEIKIHTSQRQKKVQVGKDQEKAQSEKDSHSKNRGGKKPN